MATLLQRQFSNRAYWEKREREAREKYLRTEAEELAEIDRIYREMYQWCEDEINRFYGKYAGIEGIDITDAMKKVTSLDIEQYQELAKKYVAEAQQYRKDHGARKTFSAQADAEMRLYNATMRINRLELLKARIGARMVAGTDNLDVYCGDKMTERAIEEYTRLAGILGEDVANIDTALRAKQIVNASFKNATYSQRIWSHQDRLRSAISIELQKGLIAGIGSRQMATNIRKQFDVSRKDAERLMATELRRVQTDVAMDAYKAEGITQYMYMAVNPNACPLCRSFNGKIYEVKGAEVGNPEHPLPPMHPRCFCTTAAYSDPDDYEAWLNFLESGGTTEEWNAMRTEQNIDYAERRRQRLAERQATNSEDTGLKTVIDAPKGTNKEAVRDVESVLKKLERKMGGDTIKGLSVKFTTGLKGVYAKFDDNTNTLLIPKGVNPKQVAESMQKENARYHAKWKTEKDYHATETFTGLVWHELGHAVDVSTGQRLSKSLSLNPELDEASVKVSAYAGTTQNVRVSKRSEAWAENFAAYMDGGKNKGKVPPEIRQMIEEYFREHRRRAH